MCIFDEAIKEATSKISEDYFKLRVEGGCLKWRERVYCYELYHQLKLSEFLNSNKRSCPFG